MKNKLTPEGNGATGAKSFMKRKIRVGYKFTPPHPIETYGMAYFDKPLEHFDAYLKKYLGGKHRLRVNILRFLSERIAIEKGKCQYSERDIKDKFEAQRKGYDALQADRDALAARCVMLNEKVAALENIKAERDKALSSIVRLRHMIDQLYGESIDQVAKSL